MDTECTSEYTTLLFPRINHLIKIRMIEPLPQVTPDNRVLRRVTVLTLASSFTLSVSLVMIGILTAVTVSVGQNFMLCQSSFILFRIAEYLLIALLAFSMRATYNTSSKSTKYSNTHIKNTSSSSLGDSSTNSTVG